MRALKMRSLGLALSWGLAAAGLMAAAAADPYAGLWKGTWEGMGATGSFDIQFARGSDGKLGGNVEVGTEAGGYHAKFTQLEVKGAEFSAKYDYPLDTNGEVALSGKLDGKAASGTWTLGAKGQPTDSPVAGSWTVTRQ
jgi:hypothetical protein